MRDPQVRQDRVTHRSEVGLCSNLYYTHIFIPSSIVSSILLLSRYIVTEEEAQKATMSEKANQHDEAVRAGIPADPDAHLSERERAEIVCFGSRSFSGVPFFDT